MSGSGRYSHYIDSTINFGAEPLQLNEKDYRELIGYLEEKSKGFYNLYVEPILDPLSSLRSFSFYLIAAILSGIQIAEKTPDFDIKLLFSNEFNQSDFLQAISSSVIVQPFLYIQTIFEAVNAIKQYKELFSPILQDSYEKDLVSQINVYRRKIALLGNIHLSKVLEQEKEQSDLENIIPNFSTLPKSIREKIKQAQERKDELIQELKNYSNKNAFREKWLRRFLAGLWTCLLARSIFSHATLLLVFLGSSFVTPETLCIAMVVKLICCVIELHQLNRELSINQKAQERINERLRELAKEERETKSLNEKRVSSRFFWQEELLKKERSLELDELILQLAMRQDEKKLLEKSICKKQVDVALYTSLSVLLAVMMGLCLSSCPPIGLVVVTCMIFVSIVPYMVSAWATKRTQTAEETKCLTNIVTVKARGAVKTGESNAADGLSFKSSLHHLAFINAEFPHDNTIKKMAIERLKDKLVPHDPHNIIPIEYNTVFKDNGKECLRLIQKISEYFLNTEKPELQTPLQVKELNENIQYLAQVLLDMKTIQALYATGLPRLAHIEAAKSLGEKLEKLLKDLTQDTFFQYSTSANPDVPKVLSFLAHYGMLNKASNAEKFVLQRYSAVVNRTQRAYSSFTFYSVFSDVRKDRKAVALHEKLETDAPSVAV